MSAAETAGKSPDAKQNGTKASGVKASGTKRLVIQCGIAVLWVALGAAIFVFCRGHVLLVDNRDLQGAAGAADTGIRAPDSIRVSVDGQKSLEFFRGDRDRFTVSGSRHRIRVEFPGSGRDPMETTFRLGMKDDTWILSVPALLAGREPFVEVFHIAPDPRPAEEETLPGTAEEITADGF